MFEKLLAQLLLQLIQEGGPIIIQLIIKWLTNLDGEAKEVASAAFGKAVTSALTEKAWPS